MPAGLGGFLLFWNLNLGGGTPQPPRAASTRTFLDVDDVRLFLDVDVVQLFIEADAGDQ